MLAEYLGWPQATFAGSIKSEDDKALLVGREIDGGRWSSRSRCPPSSRSTRRIVQPDSVVQSSTPPDHAYPDGVRFAALMAIMAAKKKPLVEMKLAELARDATLKVQYASVRAAAEAQGRRQGEDVTRARREAQDGSEGDLMADTLVVAELDDGQVRKSTLSAITFAKQAGAPFAILVLGAGAEGAAKELTGFGAQKVLASDDATLAQPLVERFAPTVAAVADERLRHRRRHGELVRQGPRAARSRRSSAPATRRTSAP